MLTLKVVALLAALLATIAHAANNDYPIVLVHGVMGWGRKEMLGIKYWGGLHGDIEDKLRNEGHKVFTAAVGPLSSNWDRACELFAQIKGGVVDYGEAHSIHHGHARKGRNYPGLYKEWGTKDEQGNVRKIHLIGHSMGGQTIRLLAQLLSNGTTAAPTNENPTSSILFEGGHGDWIHSITTVSTPHEGTVLADGFAIIGNIFKDILSGLIGIIGAAGHITDLVYDFKLDQWGLGPRKDSESMSDYMNRVFSSNIFQPGFKDIALYDLTRKGAKNLNSWVQDQPNIYYYSYSTADTKAWTEFYHFHFIPVQVANVLTMVLPMQFSANFIGGHFTTYDSGLGQEWQENDGAVPKLSQKGVLSSPIDHFNGVSKQGVWQYMPHLARMDHLTVCGMGLSKDPYSVYAAHADILRSLQGGKRNLRTSTSEKSHEQSFDQLKIAIEELEKIPMDALTLDDKRKSCKEQPTEPARKFCEYLHGIPS